MANNTHTLNVYRKPRAAIGGTVASPTNVDFILKSYGITNYSHVITAMGGDDSAKMTIYGIKKGEADTIYRNYVGNRASITVDNPIAPIFEGYIESVDVIDGGIRKRRSMKNMANYLSVIYSDNAGNTQTTPVQDNASVAEYGYVGKVFDAGEHNASGAGIATDLAAVELSKRAYPQEASEPSSGAFRCEIVIKGWQYALDWNAFEVSGATPATLEAVWIIVWRALLDPTAPGFAGTSYAGGNSGVLAGNGAGLFYSSNVSAFMNNTNAAFTHSSERKGGETARQFLNKLCDAGDGATLTYLWGITRTQFNGVRIPYYRAQSTTTKYRTDPAGTGRIFDTYGALQRPWTVQPDCFIEIANRTIGQFLAGTQSVYISKVEYDQNAQSVTWSTEEDISVRGTFQTDKTVKDTSSAFGAGARKQW